MPVNWNIQTNGILKALRRKGTKMKREGQKMRLFALKEILERETDDKHSITMDRILQLLKTKYVRLHKVHL